MPIKIIDLFAGPGGLGEGFSSYKTEDGKQPFKIAISIEKEESAHRTLLLRAFFRQYKKEDVPEAYYDFLKGNLGNQPEDELYQLPEVQDKLKDANREAQKLTLGEDSEQTVFSKIQDAIGKDECILIGGPPCQAYSVVGRSRNYGAKDKKYSATDDHRNFLYLEYLKIISKFQPKVFVMENVKGMLSAKVNGKFIFESIRRDLQDPYKTTNVRAAKGRKKHKYKIYSFVTDKENLEPKDFIIKAEDYGLPQARHRVILLGVREDVASNIDSIQQLLPSPAPTIQHVISDLPKLRSRLSKGKDSVDAWRNAVASQSQKTLTEIKRDVNVAPEIYDNFTGHINKIQKSPSSIGADKGFKKPVKYHKKLSNELQDLYRDERLGRYITNHESRGHIVSDLHRYMYYSTFAKHMKKSPTSKNLPEALWPNHKNFKSGKFADRFRVQLKNSHGTTVTSHISKDGHYFIHYDPNQCRSLTVREAARIQTFPDNYYFVGNRTQQYVQVGNAVPPYLAFQIAETINSILTRNRI